MSLEDISSSPRVDPRIAWVLILGIPATLVVPIVAPALLYGEHLGTVELIIGVVWCSGLGAAGLYWFYYGFSRQRGVADTPTSRIASAAQGYVEVSGEAFKLQGIGELFAHNGVPGLWYRRLGGLESEAASDGTQEPFGVRDETGYAIVLPYHAYVEAVRRHTLNDGEGKVYVEDRVYAGDKLYVLGYRAVNLIKSPEDGRAFIISTRPRRSFSRRLVAWEFLGLVAFIAGIVGAGYLGIQLLSRALV